MFGFVVAAEISSAKGLVEPSGLLSIEYQSDWSLRKVLLWGWQLSFCTLKSISFLLLLVRLKSFQLSLFLGLGIPNFKLETVQIYLRLQQSPAVGRERSICLWPSSDSLLSFVSLTACRLRR